MLREVGAGSMGTVYAAQDPDLVREVAIKVLRPTGATDRDALLSGLTAAPRQTAEQVLGLVPAVWYPFTGILRKPSATIVLSPSSPASYAQIDVVDRSNLPQYHGS